MKQTISKSYFRDAFHRAGRASQFSYEALGLIFDALENQEDDTGIEYELDVIAICCEFSEQLPAAIASDYSIEIDETENDQEIAQQVLDYLYDKTVVVGATSDGKFVYVQF
jgi:hypothetical protein